MLYRLNGRHMSFKFWFSLLHKCHVTGGYVTCSLFHNSNNGILLLLWNFRIKTKGVHLLVNEGKSLSPTHHRTTTLLSDQFGSSNFVLFKLIKVKESKNVLGPFQCIQRMFHCSSLHTEGIQSNTSGLPLTWSDLTSSQKIELTAGHIRQIFQEQTR